MKKRLLSFSLIAAAIMYCGTSANAQTLLYSNDFESGLNGSTIIGNGVIKDSENPAYGQVFHNAAGGQATRTNYLRLPENLFEDLKTSGANALSISFWVNKGTATNFNYSPIFSAYGSAPTPDNGTPMMVLQTRGLVQTNLDGTWSDFTSLQNVKGTNNESSSWINNTNWHFYTATLTPTNAKVYIDGVVMNEWTLDGTLQSGSAAGLFTIGSALNYICLGGNQAWNWNDPDAAFMYDKLKIYAGALTTAQINSLIESGSLASAVLTASKPAVYLDDKYTTETIVVNGANLGQDISITAPAGITVNPASISKTAAIDVNVSVSFNGTSLINGNITITSGTKVITIPVKTSTNSCYTPAYPTGNMIADPTFSAASLAAGGFTGWGPTAIAYTNAYCGRGTAYVRGACWPDGGSIDRPLTVANGNALVPNNTYRLRAMVNSQATADKSFQFQVEGVNGTSSIYFQIPNTNGWKQIDTTFTTGSTVTTGKGIYFNSCTNLPLITDTCFIDNWELYNITGLSTGLHSTTEYKSHTYVRDNKVVTNFNLPVSTEVSIALYNVNGMLIESRKSIFNEGNNEITLQAKLTSGVYIVRTLIDGKQRSQKIVF